MSRTQLDATCVGLSHEKRRLIVLRAQCAGAFVQPDGIVEPALCEARPGIGIVRFEEIGVEADGCLKLRFGVVVRVQERQRHPLEMTFQHVDSPRPLDPSEESHAQPDQCRR